MLKLPSSVLLIILGSLFLGLMMATSIVDTAWGARYGVTESEAVERGCDLEILYNEEDNPLAGAGVGSEWVPITSFPETPAVAEGTVYSVTMATVDAPHSHRSHDLLFNLDLDESYRGLLGHYDDNPPPSMHMEWESKYIPYLFWPMIGDRAWVMGRHVVDCGHVDASVGLLKTEIHPPSGVAFTRDEPVFFDDMPSLGTKTYIYLSGDGGYYDAPNFGSNMEFDIHLPPRPSKYAHLETKLDVIMGEAETLRITPASIPSLAEPVKCIGPKPSVPCEKKATPNICPVGSEVDSCKIHVVLPFEGRATNPGDGFAAGEAWGAILSAGWVESYGRERFTTVGFRELEVNFDDIDIEWSHDLVGSLREPFGGSGADGEWKLWAYANGKWIRMSTQGVGMGETPEFPAASKKGTYLNRVADDDYKYLGWAVKVVVPEKTGRLVIETTGWEADWMDDAIKDGSLPEVVDANDYIGIICEEYGPTNNFGVGGHKWINSVDNHDCTWSGTDDTPQDDFALGIKIVETKRWAASGLAPVADAGPDRTVCVGERVTLDGRRSIDREGGALTSYFWRQVSGPTMLLPSPTNAVTSFWAPSSGPAIGSARVTFELKVTTSTTSSDTDTVTFVIKPASTCKLPEFARPPLLGEIR